MLGVIEAIVFDLDGVLIDSEQLWDQVRRDVAQQHGGRWPAGATEAMQGMSAPEWSEYMQQVLGVEIDRDAIVGLVVDELMSCYRSHLPLLTGAVEAVQRLGRSWPLALASSSNRIVIDAVLDLAGLKELFEVTVSSEQVPLGKPSPDVYLEAARQLGVSASRCCAIEDSANGILAAASAGMTVIALPNRHFPPPADVVALAQVVLPDLAELTVGSVNAAGGMTRGPESSGASDTRAEQRLDEVEDQSFPASDPHADWAGPPD
jgi:HAD superfamily hydrolase (TIGR01509 family)